MLSFAHLRRTFASFEKFFSSRFGNCLYQYITNAVSENMLTYILAVVSLAVVVLQIVVAGQVSFNCFGEHCSDI